MAADENLADSLRALVEDTGEYVSYLRELGVTFVESAVESARGGSSPIASSTIASPPEIKKAEARITPTAAQRAALERNARAGTHAAAAVSPPPVNLQSPQDRDSTHTSQGQTDMATRKTKKYPDAVPPPPMDTLFGEITPQDEESLPQANETLEDIWTDIGICMRCPLSESRTRVVNSEGNRQARLMFIGEAPGADEDASGRPFVGRAGQLLNKIIEAIGLKREDVMIGNVNRCRPPQNRTPTLQEAHTCKPFLLREIAIVRPEVIVVLGNTAMKNLLDTKEGITKLRGKFQDYKGIKVMPTFHPAYLLRDPSKKREAWEDMKTVRNFLDGKLKE
ncbi:MAG TPA: uracil-DNA glycosylase [Pyrinomonadaceae bacterium]|jgi:DNA polymerase|nr:uracil-DNA glycosylase [Pyrinomonadaceae bacterium]